MSVQTLYTAATGMQSLDAVEKQVDALGAAIRHYN